MPPTANNTKFSLKQFYKYLVHSLHNFVNLDYISHQTYPFKAEDSWTFWSLVVKLCPLKHCSSLCMHLFYVHFLL